MSEAPLVILVSPTLFSASEKTKKAPFIYRRPMTYLKTESQNSKYILIMYLFLNIYDNDVRFIPECMTEAHLKNIDSKAVGPV